MSSRPLEHLVLVKASTVGNLEEGEECNIVLLAWVIINISKNQVVSKDQLYVCPAAGPPTDTEMPPGIPSAQLIDQGDLKAALEKFHESLTQLAGSTFSILINGHDALRQHLHPEAWRAGLVLRSYLNHYLHLNRELRMKFPSAPLTDDLGTMANFLGLTVPADGDDVQLFCEIAQKLISEGHSFQKLEVIKTADLKAPPECSLVQDDCVVKLRGLPYTVDLNGVAGFLSGLNIIPGGVVFCTNTVGRRTGEALAVVESSEMVAMALKRHKQYFKTRYVEVFAANAQDFLEMVGTGEENNTVLVVRMQGLPYRVTEDEIIDFFEPVAEVIPGGVFLVCNSSGRASGDGFVVFGSNTNLGKVMELHESTIPNYTRYVELFQSTARDLTRALRSSGSPEERERFAKILGQTIEPEASLDGLRGDSKTCVRLQGIPYTASPEDILTFFGGLKDSIAQHGVHMVLNDRNRPTGICYVQMKSEDAASEAEDTLHKKYIGPRYVEVFQCSGNTVADGLQGRGGRGGWGGGARRGRGGRGEDRSRGRSGRGSVVKVRGLPYSTREREMAEFFGDFEVTDSDVEIIFNNSGRAAGVALVTFPTKALADRAVAEKDGQHIGNRYVELSFSN